MNITRKALLPHLGMAAILLLFSVAYYGDIITKLPFGIHKWAQGDRLSLAINFYDNGLDFFKPATHSLLAVNGIVGVETPVQAYIAGALGYIFGRDNISICFRMEDILLACAGLYFLFRIVYDRTGDFVLSIIPSILIFSSPVFVYYSGNYMPDAASVSIVLIAFYFFLQYMDTGRLRLFIISALIVTLAVLIKASNVHYWIGIVCYGLYAEFILRKNRRHGLLVLGLAAIAALTIFSELWYISYLNSRYGSSLFLSAIMPFRSWEDFQSYIGYPFANILMQEYFVLAEYPVIALILSTGIYILLQVKSGKRYLFPAPVFAAGAVALFYLFGLQLTVHDYYMLPIFFPLIAYMLAISMIAIRDRFRLSVIRELRIGMFAAVVLIFFLADHQIYNRFHLVGIYDDTDDSSYWPADGAHLLDSLEVPREAHILVAGDGPPNLSLVYFDRKGYVLPPEMWHEQLDTATKFLQKKSLRYLVFKAAALKNIAAQDSAGLSRYDVIAITNDKAVLRLKP